MCQKQQEGLKIWTITDLNIVSFGDIQTNTQIGDSKDEKGLIYRRY